jgi:uncharacterized protein (DUF1697 family)
VRTHVALLRAINLAGRKFTTTETDTAKLAGALEQEIARRLDVQPGVVVLSRDELAAVIAGNPYPRTPDGLGRSELAGQLARSKTLMGTGTAGTARNWATVTRLLALLDD